ncbi:hypothetical protein HAX54_037172 [Datura stramonium]|uniref:N-acetyltransferase ESCO acetyl-transferase domain-containing protein n=1 Tax=Datura stramonium TaxID=4076 RepID=A0ABS8VLX9_DATST|nr:hypothetical protein [Datura stramonium]
MEKKRRVLLGSSGFLLILTLKILLKSVKRVERILKKQRTATQSKINSFFKPSSFPTPKSVDPSECCSIESDYGRVQQKFWSHTSKDLKIQFGTGSCEDDGDELGDGWIYHQLCKVYLFISQTISGCLVAEPIKKAYKILSTQRTAGVMFHRRRKQDLDFYHTPNLGSDLQREMSHLGTSNRRKHVAKYLLDAARESFCKDLVLKHSELAYSQPTSVGRAFISSYTSSHSFLSYTF